MPDQMTACERRTSELAILGFRVLQGKEICTHRNDTDRESIHLESEG